MSFWQVTGAYLASAVAAGAWFFIAQSVYNILYNLRDKLIEVLED